MAILVKQLMNVVIVVISFVVFSVVPLKMQYIAVPDKISIVVQADHN